MLFGGEGGVLVLLLLVSLFQLKNKKHTSTKLPFCPWVTFYVVKEIVSKTADFY